MKRALMAFLLLLTINVFGQMTVNEACDVVHQHLKVFPPFPQSYVEVNFLGILLDSPNNTEAVVSIAEELGKLQSEVSIFTFFAMCASKARVASEEFVILAKDEATTQTETLQRQLTALKLVAAQTKEECEQIMKDKPYRQSLVPGP